MEAASQPVEGSLRWHSGSGKWQQNWFALAKTATVPGSSSETTGGPSLVYAKARGTPALGSIPLGRLHKALPADGDDVAGWKQEFQGRCLLVEVGSGEDGTTAATHYLLADNRGEMLRWMKALIAIKGAQRKQSLRNTLMSLSKEPSPGAGHTTPSSPSSSSSSSLSPPQESRARASRVSSPPVPSPAITTGGVGDASRPANEQSGRARRQAILLDKPLKFQAAEEAGSQAPTIEEDGTAPAEADAEGTRDLSAVKTKLQELEERRKLVSSRGAPAGATSNTTTTTPTLTPTDEAATDSSAPQQRLRAMEAKAEQRRKQAEELVAKRQAAALMLQRRKVSPRSVPATEESTSTSVDDKKEESSTDAPQRPSDLDGWRARRKNEDEAQLNVKKMLVGELQAKIMPKSKQQQEEDAGQTGSAVAATAESADTGDDEREGMEASSEDSKSSQTRPGGTETEEETDQTKDVDDALEDGQTDEEQIGTTPDGEEEAERQERDEEKTKEKQRAAEERQRQEDEEENELKRKEAEDEQRQEEEEKRRAEREEEDLKRRQKEEEEEERKRKMEAEEERTRIEAQRKGVDDRQRADALAEKEKEKKEEKDKEEKQADEGKATDQLLKQRVEEIEEKKKRMFDRMRQREKTRRDGDAATAGPTVAPAEGVSLEPAAKADSGQASGEGERDGLKIEEVVKDTRRRSGWFAKPSGPTPVSESESEKREAMRKMLEMLSKQKAERAEERERLRKMLEERKRKKVEEYGRLLTADNAENVNRKQLDAPSTHAAKSDADSEEKHREQRQQQEDLRKLKEEMRSIRSTIVLIDQESNTLNERIAQMRVLELQERREREQKARDEQSRLEHDMREEMLRAQARDILLQRYVALHSPREVRLHEKHILEETAHNAVLINLSGILLARGRSHGNWFAHELGRTDTTPSSTVNTDAEISDDKEDERILRLKGGIVVQKRGGASEWELLALPQGALMLLDREPSGLSHSSSSNSDQRRPTAATPAVDDSEQQIDGGSDLEHSDEDEPVKRVVINIAETSPEPEHLSPDKKALLIALRQAVNNIVEHFASASSDQHLVTLGEETANKAITRLVRKELSTVLAQIFDAGFKAWKFFGSYHLWDYFEAYGQLNDSVQELAALGLRNAIKSLNANVRMTENPHIKFRALICHGLNNKYLDEWVSLLLAHSGLTTKWFNDEALLRDPKASEAVVKSLGRLKNFPFAMDINFEVRPAVVRRFDSDRAAAAASAQSLASSSASATAPSGGSPVADDEARMRMRGVASGSAARAAAAASAAAQVLSVGGGVDASSRRQSAWGRPRELNVALGSADDSAQAKVKSETKAAPTPGAGVTMWNALWGVGDQSSSSRNVTLDEQKLLDKRRGKERVRGSDEFDESEVQLERADEFKIEIKEIEPGDRGTAASTFFTSFLDLAKSIVDDDSD